MVEFPQFLKNIDPDDIPMPFESLPYGRYLISLLSVKKCYAKTSNRPNLKWLWIVVDDYSVALGRKLFSITGIGTKESASLMNMRLRRQLKAFRFEYTADFNPKDLLGRQVTIDIRKDKGELIPTIRMMPAEYFSYSRWRPDGWLF